MSEAPDWMEQLRRLAEALRRSADEAQPGHDSDCRWCPICQAAAAVRGERPEVTAALADLLTTTADALRTFAEAPAQCPPTARDSTGDASGHESGHKPGHEATDDEAGYPAPEVQRIEIA